MLRLSLVVILMILQAFFCDVSSELEGRRSRSNRQRSRGEPIVTRDAESCSYVINIPAPESCKDFQYRDEMDSLTERVRVLEAILSELIDTKDSITERRPCTDCEDEYSIEEENFSSSTLESTNGPNLNSATTDVTGNNRKQILQEVLVPHQPIPPLREVIPAQTTHIGHQFTPRIKPYEEDFVAPPRILIPLNETESEGDTKAEKEEVPVKKPSSITSTRSSSSSSVSGVNVEQSLEESSEEGGESENDIISTVAVDDAAIVTSPTEDEDDTDTQSVAYFPNVPEVNAEVPAEKSITSEIEGGSYLIFSSSEGGAADISPDAEEEGDNTDPTEVRDDEDDPENANGGNKRRPYMNIMTSQDGHRGDLIKPRWKIFKELMDLKTLRGHMSENGKRPRPKGMGKPNDCILDGCLCLRKKGFTENGIYYLENPEGSGKRGKHVRLYCDMNTDGGGWTVIQRRQNGTTNFYRNWNDYAKGFGYLDGDFWMGNHMLHALTSKTRFILRVEFTDWDDVQGYAEYDKFYVKDEDDFFRLILGPYMGGNAGDALTYHNNTQFSTRDRDHDSSIGNCAFLRQAGFWFRACNKANPNGRWLARADARGLNGAVVSWGTWEGRKYTYCLKSFRMMIRSQNSLSALTTGTEERTVDDSQTRGRRGNNRRNNRDGSRQDRENRRNN